MFNQIPNVMKNTFKNEPEKEPKKTVYKEKESRAKEPSNGETSSLADLDRTSFTSRPTRTNKPLGSGHEPGTRPGSDT